MQQTRFKISAIKRGKADVFDGGELSPSWNALHTFSQLTGAITVYGDERSGKLDLTAKGTKYFLDQKDFLSSTSKDITLRLLGEWVCS